MDPNQPGPSTSMIKIKTEPGLAPARLPSFRVPRDLTLGANIKLEKTSKKVYTPNLNVQRRKKEDGPAVQNNTAEQSKAKGRGRGRGQADRGGKAGGRGGKTSNLVQSAGVFSQGISDASVGRRSGGGGFRSGGGGGDRDPQPVMERPKLNLNNKIDKFEEDQKLKNLLRDDFIDDGNDDPDENAPISLPWIATKLCIDKKSKNKLESDDEEEEEIDKKPVILKDGTAVMPSKKSKSKKMNFDSTQDEGLRNVPQTIENSSNGYVMFRFPDCLPGFQKDDDEQTNSKNEEKHGVDNKSELCTLRSLKQGFLGKIKIHQSGKATLQLGDNLFNVDTGSRLGFRQDIIIAKLEEGTNQELINLGPVSNTLICTPDFESILSKM